MFDIALTPLAPLLHTTRTTHTHHSHHSYTPLLHTTPTHHTFHSPTTLPTRSTYISLTHNPPHSTDLGFTHPQPSPLNPPRFDSPTTIPLLPNPVAWFVPRATSGAHVQPGSGDGAGDRRPPPEIPS